MNRRLLSVIAVVCLSLSSPLYAGFSRAQDFHAATPEELAMKNAPGDSGASAVVLDWVRFDDDVYSVGSEYLRIKVLTDEGKKYADVEVPYYATYPYNAYVTDISARTIHPDGTIVPFDGKIYDKVLYKAGHSAVRAKTFTLADVTPGSIIEYRYQTHWSDSLLPNTDWTIQKDIPVLHLKFTLKPYDTQGEFGSFFTYQGLPDGKVPVKTKESFDLELQNVAAFQSESFTPPEEQLRARVNFYYTASKTRLSEFWNVESASWSKKIESFIGKSNGAAAVAQKFAGITDPTEKLMKIYAHVQGMRNYSFETAKSDQEAAKQSISAAKNVEEVIRNNAGYRDELNRAFVAIARAAGFNASAARVPSRDRYFFSDKIPDAAQMNSEVAMIEIPGGKPLFLDPGTPYAPFGIVSWEKTGVPAIHVVKGSPASWTKIPEQAPAQAVTSRKAELQLDDEDTLTGKVTITFTGQEALVRRLQGLGDEESARKKAIEDEVKGWFPAGATAKLTALTGLTSIDDPLVATFDVKLPNLVSRAGSRVVLPVSVFEAASKNPFSPEKRSNPIYFEYGRMEDDEVTVKLPAGVKPAALPNPVQINGGSAFMFTSSVAAAGDTVTFKRNFQISVLLIETKFYSAVRGLFAAVAAADQKPLVLQQAAK